MKFKNTISLLVLGIAVLALVVSAVALFSTDGPGQHQITSLRGETVDIYGQGLYKNDSVAMAVQAKAQDIVTVVLGIPLLLVSLVMARKNSLIGRLLLTGTLGYFLYTYVSYTFIAMYNPVFLVYVLLMAASFFAFTLAMVSFDMEELRSAFTAKLPVKVLGSFVLFMAVMIGLMWLGRIVPPLMSGGVPVGLEHYTTLVIQAMDLGFVLPTQIIGAILLMRRKPFGYLLFSVMMVKIITLLTALTAMIIGQAAAGVQMSVVEMSLFPIFNLIAIICFVVLLKNITEKRTGDAPGCYSA